MPDCIALEGVRPLERFVASGIEAQGNSPDEFAAMVKSKVARYGELAKAAGVRPDQAVTQ